MMRSLSFTSHHNCFGHFKVFYQRVLSSPNCCSPCWLSISVHVLCRDIVARFSYLILSGFPGKHLIFFPNSRQSFWLAYDGKPWKMDESVIAKQLFAGWTIIAPTAKVLAQLDNWNWVFHGFMCLWWKKYPYSYRDFKVNFDG